MLPFGLRRLLGENLIEIERSVFGGILEAERDLLVGQRGLGIRSILGLKLPGAQSGLDRGAQFPANAVEVARDTGFVFPEFAADGCESLLVGVIEAQALAIARVQRVESLVERVGEKREVARTMGIG